MKPNYIEINFTGLPVLDYDEPAEREDAIKEYTEVSGEVLNPGEQFHPNGMNEINDALKVLYPQEKMEIDWRDPTTVWIWPNGMMAQWS